jgi:hypothetical protein
MAAPTGHIVSYGVGLGTRQKSVALSAACAFTRAGGLGRSCSTSLLGGAWRSGRRSQACGVVVVLTVGLEAPVPWDGCVDEQFDELAEPEELGLAGIATW